MNFCEQYDMQNNDIKSLLIGFTISVPLQEYYKDIREPEDTFFDDYIGYKYYSYLRNPGDKDYYLSQYGDSVKTYMYTTENYVKYLENPNSPDFDCVHLKERRNNFKKNIVNFYNEISNCEHFIRDIINALWKITIKWTEKSKNFININKRYCIGLKPPKTINKREAEKIVKIANEEYSPGKGIILDEKTLSLLLEDSGFKRTKKYRKKSRKRTKKYRKRTKKSRKRY